MAKKPITKADLVEEIKVKQINDAIEEDIKSSDEIIAILKKKENTYLATIKKLEETIKTLKSTKPSKHSTFAETQTLADDEDSVLISCNLCIYVATCEEQLTWHMGEDHGKETNYFDTDFLCYICGKWCRSDADLAHHTKKHGERNIEHQIFEKASTENIYCYFCADNFRSIKELMIHKKKEHTEKMSTCWSLVKCIAGSSMIIHVNLCQPHLLIAEIVIKHLQ